MKKKIFLGLICCLLVLGVFTGCGKTSNDSPVDILSENKLNWTSLNISLDDNNYQYPLRVVNFIENGWIAFSSEDEQKLNKMVESNDGYNFVTLKKGGLLVYIYVDNQVSNISVRDSNVVNFSISKEVENCSTSFEVDGFKVGSVATKSEIESKFGIKNYEILSDEKFYTYHYYKELDNLKVQLEIVTNIKTNEIIKISLSNY